MAFEVIACGADPTVVTRPAITGAARCMNAGCSRFVSFTAHVATYQEREDLLLEAKSRRKDVLVVTEFVSNMKIFPEPPKPDVPEFLPDDIRELFSDAEAVRLIGEQGARASVGQYRSVLDKTLPALAQDAEVPTTDDKGKELSRFPLLDRLSKADVLPTSIRNWIGSDGIRKILTAASHGEKITSEQAQELSDITRFILIYVFTLPERVKRARNEFIQ